MERGQTLLIDADDTLWENNLYFEEIVRAYCEVMARQGHSPAAARETLNAVERVRTKTNGYGINNFRTSLFEACSRLLGREPGASEWDRLEGLCARLSHQSIRLLPGVAETLQELSGRHRLILFTKGDLDDQVGKVQQSGLGRYLHRVDVVREKDRETYCDAMTRHGIHPSRGWMVGNSPRSDIVPALDAGLGAVFVPHRATWELELTPLPPTHERLQIVGCFTDLVTFF